MVKIFWTPFVRVHRRHCDDRSEWRTTSPANAMSRIHASHFSVVRRDYFRQSVSSSDRSIYRFLGFTGIVISLQQCAKVPDPKQKSMMILDGHPGPQSPNDEIPRYQVEGSKSGMKGVREETVIGAGRELIAEETKTLSVNPQGEMDTGGRDLHAERPFCSHGALSMRLKRDTNDPKTRTCDERETSSCRLKIRSTKVRRSNDSFFSENISCDEASIALMIKIIDQS